MGAGWKTGRLGCFCQIVECAHAAMTLERVESGTDNLIIEPLTLARISDFVALTCAMVSTGTGDGIVLGRVSNATGESKDSASANQNGR